MMDHYCNFKLFAAYLLAREGKSVRLFDANDVLNNNSNLKATRALAKNVQSHMPRWNSSTPRKC